eukprot:scaffold104667_cov23-Tisochrysis_lutea.AAC.1
MVVVGQLMPPLTPPPPPTEGPVRSYAKERYDFLMDLGVSTKKEEDTGSKQKVRKRRQYFRQLPTSSPLPLFALSNFKKNWSTKFFLTCLAYNTHAHAHIYTHARTHKHTHTQVQRALGGTAGEEVCASGRALFHISLRTSSPGVAAAVERDMAPAFVADLAPGCLEVMRRGAAKAAAARVQGQGGGLKPPLHPRVAALHAGRLMQDTKGMHTSFVPWHALTL